MRSLKLLIKLSHMVSIFIEIFDVKVSLNCDLSNDIYIKAIRYFENFRFIPYN